jgi:hypothetical protein
MNTQPQDPLDPSDPPECILECGACHGTAFALGERGTVWCKSCYGRMNVMVGVITSNPQPMVADCVAEA